MWYTAYHPRINIVACRPVSVTTSKHTTKQHLQLGKYTQPLLGNDFANDYVPTDTIGK
jgi:hypothetical protein